MGIEVSDVGKLTRRLLCTIRCVWYFRSSKTKLLLMNLETQKTVLSEKVYHSQTFGQNKTRKHVWV